MRGAVGRILGGLQNSNLEEERERERDEQREFNTHLGSCAPGADRCAHSAGPDDGIIDSAYLAIILDPQCYS